MKDYPKVKQALRKDYNINARPMLRAEWNYNRYVGTTVDNAITEKETGFNIHVFPIESIVEPNRPRQGIVKARIGEKGKVKPGVISDNYTDTKPNNMCYVVDSDDKYKYWCSPYPSSIDLAGDNWGFQKKWGMDSVNPIVYYDEAVEANKIVIQFEATYAKPTNFSVRLFDAFKPNEDWEGIFDETDLDRGRLTLYWQGKSAGNDVWGTSPTYARHSPDQNCTRKVQAINLTVFSIDKEDMHLELIEMSARLERDLTDDLVTMDTDSELSEESTVAPLGKASSNTGNISLNNIGYRYSKKNGLYANITDYGVKFRGKYIYKVDGVSYYIQDFEMFSESAWQFDEMNVSISIRDASLFLQDIKPNKILNEELSVGRNIWSLLDSVGFNKYEYNKPISKKSMRIKWFWTDKTLSMWEVLAELAEISQSAVYFDHRGFLQIKTREEVYDELLNPKWTFTGVSNDTRLADIVTSPTADRTFTSNKINVTYRNTDISGWRDGYPKLADSWSPEDETVALRAAPLRKPMTRGGKYVRISKDDAKIWPYKSAIQVDAEIMEYDGKGYIYYDENKKKKFKIINSEAELKRTKNELSHPQLKHKNYFTGGLRIVKRGAWNTNRASHKIDIKGYKLSYTEGELVKGATKKPKKKKHKKDKKNKKHPNKKPKKNLLQGFQAGANNKKHPNLINWEGLDKGKDNRKPKKKKDKKKNKDKLQGGTIGKDRDSSKSNGYWDPIKGKKKKGVGKINQVYAESTMRIKSSKRFKANQRLLVRRGRPADKAYRHLGCRIRFNKGDFKHQRAGIMFNSAHNGTANYIELAPTNKLSTKYRKKRGEVYAYWTENNREVFPIGGKGSNMAIVEGVWYDIDIDWEQENGFNYFNIYINGSLRISQELPSNICVDPSGYMGLFVRGNTSVDVEYLYAFRKNEKARNMEYATFYDKIKGGYTNDRFWREWTWNRALVKISGKSGGKPWFSTAVARGNQFLFDEFGAIVREIREFNVKFERPVQHSQLFFDNHEEVHCPVYRSDSFGAHFFLVNVKRNNVIVSGEDTREWNGETVSRVLKVLGREIIEGEEKTTTVKDEDMITRRGQIETEVTSRWIQSKDEAEELGEWLKGRISRDFSQYTMEVFGNPLLQIGDVVKIDHPEVKEGSSIFLITALQNSWEGGLGTTVTMRRITKSGIM